MIIIQLIFDTMIVKINRLMRRFNKIVITNILL